MTIRKLKILHVIKSLGRGGAEMLLPETLKLHQQDKFEFHYIYFLPWKNQMVSSLEQQGGIVHCFKASNNLQILWKAGKVARYVRDNNIDLIHAHLPWAGIVSRIAGRISNVKVIYTEHNKQERYHFITRLLNLKTMNWLFVILAVSNDVAQSIKKHKPNLTAPVRTILNGVNLNYFAPGLFDGREIRDALGIDRQVPVIGTIAVFRLQKRLDIWIEIAKKIHDKLPDVRFIIVGDGPLKQLLLDKRIKFNMENIIHFVGLQTDVRPYLASFDMYMMSSIFEGLPVSLLEAMASGCPVISTDAGGIKEVIRHNEDGLLCSTSEPEKLAPLAIGLLTNEAKRQEFKKQSRTRIEEKFSLDKMVFELEEMYYQVTLTMHATL